MKNLIKSVAGSGKKSKEILNALSAMELRLANVEMALDAVIEHPTWIHSKEIGFNWQKHRKLIFEELLNTFNFEAIIETGTWIGHTTGYMAYTSKLPIYTCELNKRFYNIARSRLKEFSNIIFDLSDSLPFLTKMSKSNIKDKKVFIYLDSHWYANLPLKEEIEIISKTWKDFVIMIDDFQVPGDNGYGYDNYGSGNSITLAFIADLLKKYDLVAYFPSASSAEETGGKRGSAVLARKGNFSEKLDKMKSLKRGNI